MMITCWSVKGGSGTSVVAAATAVLGGRSSPGGSLLVDLTGDASVALGDDDRLGPGIADWVATVASGSGPVEVGAAPRASSRVDPMTFERRIDRGVSILPRGAGRIGDIWSPAADLLVARLRCESRTIVVDAGTLGAAGDGFAAPFVSSADRSILVIRPCYLALRRASSVPVHPDGIVVVSEPGRSLGSDDITAVIGAPVVAEVRVEPRIARVVDAGLLCSRMPRDLDRALADVVAS